MAEETTEPKLAPELRAACLKDLEEIEAYLALKRKALGKTADDQMFVDGLHAVASVADTMLMNLRQRACRAGDALREESEDVVIVAERVVMPSY